MFGRGLINACLEFLILSSQDLYLAFDGLELDFCVFGGQNLILVITLNLEKLSVGLGMISLLLLIPLNPHLPRFFLPIDDLIQTSDLFGHLFFRKFSSSLDSLLLNLDLLKLSLQIYHLLI